MNHSINYSGFIDLAMEATTISSTASTHNTEDFKPALDIHLTEDNDIEVVKHGGFHRPPSFE